MVLLVNPGSFSVGLNEATLVPPLGLLYIATVLNENGFKAEVYDAALKGASIKKVLKTIEEKNPKVIGLRLYYYNINWARVLINGIREINPTTIIGIGGDCASYNPRKIIEKTGADFAIVGEGEMSMLALLKNVSIKKEFYEDVPGITAIKKDGGYYIGPVNTRIKDLDSLPYPDYDLVGGLKLYSSRAGFRPAAPILTTRGCPFRCSFCARNVFGNLVTFRSPENIIQEIAILKNKYGIRQIDVIDDNFTASRANLEKFLDLVTKENIGVAFDLHAGVRVEPLNEEILTKMKRAGFYRIAFGIESADNKVLDLCNKQLNLDKLKRIAVFAKKLGFKTCGFFIIGLPGETRDSVRKTLDLAKEIKLDVANFCMATPYPGTELYEHVRKYGDFLFDPEDNYDFGFYGGKAFYVLPNLDEKEMLYRFRYAYRKFYTIPKILTGFGRVSSIAELKWFISAAISVLRGQFQTSNTDLKRIKIHKRLYNDKL